MLMYNREKKKVEDAIKLVKRNFAKKVSEINKLELSEEEKQNQIDLAYEITNNNIEILNNTNSLAELSEEIKEDLGVNENSEPKTIDTNIIDTLVSIYAQKAKVPHERNTGILDAITLNEDEQLEDIDTKAFEDELRQYFTEHYYDLFDTGYNSFLSKIVEQAYDYGIFQKEYGDLCKIAIKHNIDPKKFNYFGYQLNIQEGLVVEENSTLAEINNIFYATPQGINNRIFDLHSELLYRKQKNSESFFLDDIKKLKNNYITYAEKNGIQIENPDVVEIIDVDMAKVEGIAKYINRVVNGEKGIEKGDYTKLFSDDIVKNYSKIMGLTGYNFNQLESVKRLCEKSSILFIKDLFLDIEEDNITLMDPIHADIAYGTPEFVKNEYQSIMQEVKRLHATNAFIERYFDVEKITEKKHAYRRYIQENAIEGIDISIPDVEIDHEKTGMIADAIMAQYGENCEDAENMRNRILTKLEDSWAEIVTEAQVVGIDDLFSQELKEMGHEFADEHLYVKDDFIYLGDYIGFTSNVIYATQEALTENLKFLDERISSRDIAFEEKEIRKGLVKYAKEQNFDINIPSVENLGNKRRQEREIFPMRGLATEFMTDDPTAREEIRLEDTIFDTIYKISEGVPGAIVPITELMKSQEKGFLLLLSLDDMNIRGSQIWEAYKYLYNEDIEKFAKAIQNRDPKMIEFINQELASVGGEKAVFGGASFDRSKMPEKYRFTEEEVEQLKQDRENRKEREKQIREKLIANSPAKKVSPAKKRRDLREAKRQAYRERLIANGKKSIGELDKELTDLQAKEQQAKELYEQYEQQLPEQSNQEEL